MATSTDDALSRLGVCSSCGAHSMGMIGEQCGNYWVGAFVPVGVMVRQVGRMYHCTGRIQYWSEGNANE